MGRMSETSSGGTQRRTIGLAAIIVIIIILIAAIVSQRARREPSPTPTAPPTVARPADTPTPAPTIPVTRELLSAQVVTEAATAQAEATAQASTVETVPAAPGARPVRAYLRVESTELQMGQPVQVQVVLERVVNLYAAQFHLVYDQNKIQVRDENERLEGVQIEPGPSFPKAVSFVALNEANNERGHVYYGVTLLGTQQSGTRPLMGEVVVASLTIVGQGSGATELDLLSVELADSKADTIPVQGEAIVLQIAP